MSLQTPQEIVNDIEKLLEDEEGYDVIIYAGENENMKEIHAHSSILRVRSQYFRTVLSSQWAEKRDGKYIFKKPNVLPHFFKMIIRFIYCGKIELENLQGLDVLKFLIAVDEINIQTLTDHVKEYLVNNQNQLLQQNPIEILEFSYQYKEIFKDLLNLTLNKICGEPNILFNSDKFTSLEDSLLELIFKRDDLLLNEDILFKSNIFFNLKASFLKLILKRDDLKSDEIIIWDNLIKWCLAQNSNISQDPKQWSKDEITIMERTIHNFISSIRFYYISSEDFVTKVYPFKKIIPKDLINDMLTFHMTSTKQLNMNEQYPRQSKCNVDSVIINQNHIAIFASWIHRKPNVFNLLYRASRDGKDASIFHSKCDNKGATICVVKISNSDQIVGGYNPTSWESGGGKDVNTYGSFVFSFTNKNNLESAKVGYYKNLNYSARNNSNYGPIFGDGHDLYWYSNNGSWYSNNSGTCYSKIDVPSGTFSVDDYEVFKVDKT